jgi:hypothetical protein
MLAEFDKMSSKEPVKALVPRTRECSEVSLLRLSGRVPERRLNFMDNIPIFSNLAKPEGMVYPSDD